MLNAEKFFSENQNLFTNPTGEASEVEKFNLYGGLYALADNIDEIRRMLQDIQGRIYSIESRVGQIR